tara:strand:+ start:117 stop:383 length:267 start_codon:yes stop_codon:yes gene_type:complete
VETNKLFARCNVYTNIYSTVGREHPTWDNPTCIIVEMGNYFSEAEVEVIDNMFPGGVYGGVLSWYDFDLTSEGRAAAQVMGLQIEGDT